MTCRRRRKSCTLAVELGSIDLNPVLQGALATISYFLVGTAVLIFGFIVVDLLTPGKLRQLVFVDRRPNAVILACANYIAVAAVVICAITSSYRQLGQGLIGVAVYGIIGVILQGVAIFPCTSWYRAISTNTSTSPSCIRLRSPRP